jgi:hypothetical protein
MQRKLISIRNEVFPTKKVRKPITFNEFMPMKLR